MAAKVKQLVPWLIAALLIYAVVTAPNRSAGVVRDIWGFLLDAFRNIGQFFSSLLGG